MRKVVVLLKKEGETPLACLERFRRRSCLAEIKMTYAGRLDPMASGLMLVLVGDEVKNKEKYLKLDKQYEFEALFGFTTDTYDILGRVIYSDILENIRIEDLEENIKNNLKYFTGRFIQKYPLYSSKTVKGKQLFAYAREGAEVEAPSREVTVKKLKFLKIRRISREKLLREIEKRVGRVEGDFRQREILSLWRKHLGKSKIKYYPIASFKIDCSSGTYVRSIAHSLGERVGLPALAYSIKRTKVGKFAKIQE